LMRGEEGDVRGVRLQVGHNAGLYSDERRRAWISRIVLGLIVLIAVVVGGCSRQPPEELVEEHCTDCHTMAIIEASGKTDQECVATVSRMIELGAGLNDRQAQEVIDYLSGTYGAESP